MHVCMYTGQILYLAAILRFLNVSAGVCSNAPATHRLNLVFISFVCLWMLLFCLILLRAVGTFNVCGFFGTIHALCVYACVRVCARKYALICYE
jgi:hypothetical protein